MNHVLPPIWATGTASRGATGAAMPEDDNLIL
jgi:hypothetical protein